MHNYHSSFKMFPINWGQGTSLSSKGQSWLTMLLPRIEVVSLYESIDPEQSINHGPNWAAAQRVVSTYRCPSDTGDGTTTDFFAAPGEPVGVTNYKSVMGSNWEVDLVTSASQVVSTRGRNANNPDGKNHGNGVICRGQGTHQERAPNGNMVTKPGAAIPTRIRDIRDGTSHTFAAGEAVPEYCYATSWYIFTGANATCGIPLNYEESGQPPAGNDWNKCHGFRSRHAGGGHFALCDGSVKFVNENIETLTYRGMATISGGEILDDEPE